MTDAPETVESLCFHLRELADHAMLQIDTDNLPDGWTIESEAFDISSDSPFVMKCNGVVIAHGHRYPEPQIRPVTGDLTAVAVIRDVFAAKVRGDQLDHEIRRDRFLEQCAREAVDRAKEAARAVFVTQPP